MSVLDILNQPWAITPEKLEAMHVAYESHGKAADLEPIKAAYPGDSRGANDYGYTVQDGVAVIPVDGVLAKRMNMFLAYSGGTSTQMLLDTVSKAIEDPSVHSLMLSIDSPGGEVDGTQQVGDVIAKSTKPTAAWIDGMGCSAAYWIAAQCDSVYASSDTAMVGSIGVIVQHVDKSKANEQAGKAVTHITAGKYKAITHGDAPLSPDGRTVLQDRVDYLCTLFVDAVATGRGVTPDTVVANMGDGRIFIGRQAVTAGLVDAIAGEQEVIAKLVAQQQKTFNQSASALKPQSQKEGNSIMAFKTFETEDEYNRHLAVEHNRGAAIIAADQQAQAALPHQIAAKITAHIHKVKREEGRTIHAAQASAELQRDGLI